MTATVATTREDVVATAKVLEPKPIEPAPTPEPVATPAVDPAPTPEPVATPAVDPAPAPEPVATPVVDPEPLPATTKPTKKAAEKAKEKEAKGN